MDFYRASYTSFDGSITDFIVPVKSGTQTMHEVVLSAFHQLEMLKIYSGECPSVEDISIAAVFSDDPYRRYYIASDMLIPPNIHHFYFSHTASLPFVITGESKDNRDLKRRSSSPNDSSSSKMLKHASGDLVRDHFPSQESNKNSISPGSTTVVDTKDKGFKVSSTVKSTTLLDDSSSSESQSNVHPLQTTAPSESGLEVDGVLHKDAAGTTVFESPEAKPQNAEVSSLSNNVKITFLSDSDSSGSSESSSSEDEDEKRIREERKRKEEAESARIQREKEKHLLEEERRKKMHTSFFDESDDSSSTDDRITQESTVETQKPLAEATAISGSEQRATVTSAAQQSPHVESSSSSDDSSSSSSSESEEEQPLPTSMGMLSSLLNNSTPVVKESKTTKKVPPKPQVLTSSGPSRSFKNIYKDGNIKEEIEVPTPVLPVAADVSKRFKKRLQRKQSK